MNPTNLRNVRVSDDLWSEARAVASARGESLSEVIRAALVAYVKKNGRNCHEHDRTGDLQGRHADYRRGRLRGGGEAGRGTVVIAGGEDSAAPIFLTASEVFELADWLRSLQVKTVDAS